MKTYYKNLIVWQKSIEIVKVIYKITSNFPQNQLYSLTNQIQRSAVSIPSNIAEWSARNSIKEFIQFLYIAKWSAAELETQIIISKELWFIDSKTSEKLENDILEILKMLSSLIENKKNLKI